MQELSHEVRQFILACEMIHARLDQGERLTDEERDVIDFSAKDLLTKLNRPKPI